MYISSCPRDVFARLLVGTVLAATLLSTFPVLTLRYTTKVEFEVSIGWK